MKTCLRILIFFLLVTQICFAQWFWQNPLPQGNTLNDVYFVDENKGWAVGSRGTLLQTVDGGTSWISGDFETGLNFKSISFVNQDCGWILAIGDVGYNPANRIYKTTNGGADWFIQAEIDTIGELSEFFLSSIFFVNANVGWAISEWDTISIILKTTNGGIDWIDQSYSATLYRDLKDCYFIDENTGWILGTEYISPGLNLLVIMTTNGGITWTEKQIPDTGSTGIYPGEIFFINNNLGWATSSGDILKTTDGGLNWMQETISGGTIRSIFFLNDQVGYAVGGILDGGQILKTTDGGTSWNEQYFDQMSFSSVFFANNQKGFIVGQNGEILKTTDSGESWQPFNDNFYFNCTKICMVDALNGWAIGDARASYLSGRLIKTTDGGITWNLIQHPTDSYPTIFFINCQVGWVGGLDRGIWKTTDSGLSWTQQIGNNLGSIEDIFFINEDYGWAAKCGSILRTTNSGEGWTSVNIGTHLLDKIFFINENIGWVIGPYDIVKTIDGGVNWLPLTVPNGGWVLSSIHFFDAYNGWISGAGFDGFGGALFSTTDAGLSWINELTSYTTTIEELEFLDDINGYFIGVKAEGLSSPLEGVVYKTTNGGTSWVPQPTGTHQSLWDISFSDANNGWVVGSGGTILHTTNGGGVVPVELNSFIAQALDQKVILKWTTATELNNNGFEIQRRVAESDFATIAFIRGEGTTTNQKEYSYIDKDLVDGKYFYRLKQIDYNGAHEYSDVIEVDVRSLNEYALEQNFPNPFNPITTIGYVLKERTNAKLVLLNAIGEEVAVLVNEEQDKGFHKIDFNASTLSSGVYFYRLQAGEFIQTRKMVLLK